ncbi:MAG: 1,4-alpha-glucan branching enzyme, partial [Thermodesulfobacteriota bacterium]|nr:1,4-alpha-glucan branching enzyme [Thermodesulfobacteriota bacterium]
MTDSPAGRAVHGVSLLTEHDIYLFKQGRHYRLYLKLGAHLLTHNGEDGTLFAVWAPNAEAVSVVGDFNAWTPGAHPMTPRLDESGIWECFIPSVGPGALYKYHIASRFNGFTVEKGDPFAFCWETPPSTASRVWDLDYQWGDKEWMASRHQKNGLQSPISIYEMHMGSWRRVPEDGNRSLSYRETAAQLADHLADRNFTHVEFMPVMEHPFYGSWGYQTTGYFAPTSRYGSPQDFMYLMDALHRRG